MARRPLAALVLLLAPLALSTLAPRAHAGNCAPVPAGLVAWWKLEGNGNDETGAHNGAVIGAGTFGPGEVGLGYASNATNNAVVVPHGPGLGRHVNAVATRTDRARSPRMPGQPFGETPDRCVPSDRQVSSTIHD